MAAKHWLWMASANLLFLYIGSGWAIPREINKCLWAIPWFPERLRNVCKFLDSLQNMSKKEHTTGNKTGHSTVMHRHAYTQQNLVFLLAVLAYRKIIRKDFPMERECKDYEKQGIMEAQSCKPLQFSFIQISCSWRWKNQWAKRNRFSHC